MGLKLRCQSLNYCAALENRPHEELGHFVKFVNFLKNVIKGLQQRNIRNFFHNSLSRKIYQTEGLTIQTPKSCSGHWVIKWCLRGQTTGKAWCRGGCQTGGAFLLSSCLQGSWKHCLTLSSVHCEEKGRLDVYSAFRHLIKWGNEASGAAALFI